MVKIVLSAAAFLLGALYFIFLDPKRAAFNERMRTRNYDYDTITGCFIVSSLYSLGVMIVFFVGLFLLSRAVDAIKSEYISGLLLLYPVIDYIFFVRLLSKKN